VKKRKSLLALIEAVVLLFVLSIPMMQCVPAGEEEVTPPPEAEIAPPPPPEEEEIMKEGKLSPEDFHMPAEWEEHEGTWLQWPHDDQWPGYRLELEKSWLEMVDALHEHENVHIVVQDERRREHVEQQIKSFGIDLENIDFHIIPTNDVWVRDNGPIFVVNEEGELAITNWQFNGWGARYAHEIDNQVPPRIGENLGVLVFSPSMVLEGGAVEVNGKGTFMATRTSIINPNRNPDMTQKDIEETIKEYLGIKHFIWLSGMSGDDPELGPEVTDCHIDGSARFVNESTVLYNWSDDEENPEFRRILKVHYGELKNATTESGKPLTLVPLPNTKYQYPVYSTTGPELGRGSYCNYLVANGVVLVPVYGDPNDDRAKEIIGQQFPDRDIVGIDCKTIFQYGGMIHCVTQQQPVVR